MHTRVYQEVYIGWYIARYTLGVYIGWYIVRYASRYPRVVYTSLYTSPTVHPWVYHTCTPSSVYSRVHCHPDARCPRGKPWALT